jgi:hypothetical protein
MVTTHVIAMVLSCFDTIAKDVILVVAAAHGVTVYIGRGLDLAYALRKSRRGIAIRAIAALVIAAARIVLGLARGAIAVCVPRAALRRMHAPAAATLQ